MRAILLSAGFGSRLGDRTRLLPKPMFLLGDTPILESNLVLARDAGAELAVINLHYLAEVITNHFGDGTWYGIPIHWSYEAPLRGTGGALDQAREILSGHRLLIIYADNLFVGPVKPIIRAHEESGALATVARLWREDVRSSGEIILAEDNRVEAILEKQPGPAHGGWVNAGLVVAEPELLDHVPASATSDLAIDVLPGALRAGATVMSVPFPGHVWWIDTPEDLRRAREQFSRFTGTPGLPATLYGVALSRSRSLPCRRLGQIPRLSDETSPAGPCRSAAAYPARRPSP